MLLEKKCIPCSIGDTALSDEQIKDYLKEVGDWKVEKGKLTKSFKFKDFREALIFTNLVGDLAEDQGHHPVIKLGWGFVKIDQWTNMIQGLHENDFIMAAKINLIAEDAS